MSVPESDWKWFGMAGHFICGRWCRFHMTTQVGSFLVSTVGKYVHPRHGGGREQGESAWLHEHPDGEEIGCGRFYETMVFEAGAPCEADGCNCGQPTIVGSELDCEGYKTVGDAVRGHNSMCEKWASRGVD